MNSLENKNPIFNWTVYFGLISDSGRVLLDIFYDESRKIKLKKIPGRGKSSPRDVGESMKVDHVRLNLADQELPWWCENSCAVKPLRCCLASFANHHNMLHRYRLTVTAIGPPVTRSHGKAIHPILNRHYSQSRLIN